MPHTQLNVAAAFETADEGYSGTPFPRPPREFTRPSFLPDSDDGGMDPGQALRNDGLNPPRPPTLGGRLRESGTQAAETIIAGGAAGAAGTAYTYHATWTTKPPSRIAQTTWKHFPTHKVSPRQPRFLNATIQTLSPTIWRVPGSMNTRVVCSQLIQQTQGGMRRMLARYDLHHAGVDRYKRSWMNIPLRIFCRSQVCPHGLWSTLGYTIISESIRTLATIEKKCLAKFRPPSLDMTCEIRSPSSVRSSRVILWKDSMKIFAYRSFGLYMPFRVLSWKLFCTRLRQVMYMSRQGPLLIAIYTSVHAGC